MRPVLRRCHQRKQLRAHVAVVRRRRGQERDRRLRPDRRRQAGLSMPPKERRTMATVEEGLQAQIRNIEATYGKPMREWLAIVAASGLTKHTDVVRMLKTDYGLAWLRQAYDHAS